MPVEQGRQQTGNRSLHADVVIVGSGAGGGMAAHDLAATGAKVVVLEEGPWLEQQQMTQREDAMLPLLYQERGGRATTDRAIRVMGGRCVGGSTVHNTNLCKRAPAEVLERWRQELHVSGLSTDEMAALYDSVERSLSVSDIDPSARNANNRTLERGLETLGWRGGGLRHNRSGCAGSGFCELGCPFNAKQNAAKVLIPGALERGAFVFADARVDQILHDERHVKGVVATTLGADRAPTGQLNISANAVVLAGSAIGSSALMLKSNVPDRSSLIGTGLHLHPGVAVAGLFAHDVEGWKGIPQSVECTELLDFTKGSSTRIWITTAFAHPVGSAVMLPGFGAEHREWMKRYAKLAVLTAMVHDESSGRVSVSPTGRPRIDYKLGAGDRQQLDLGIKACARLLFAAGADRVLVPCIPPVVLSSAASIDAMPAIVRPHAISLTAVHPMGGLRLGDDPNNAVMQCSGEHHTVKGLFACDGSLFPTGLGVPPQLSIYSISRHVSRFVARSLGLSRAADAPIAAALLRLEPSPTEARAAR